MRCSFVGTYMEREAEALIVENLSKKYVHFSQGLDNSSLVEVFINIYGTFNTQACN